MREEELRRHHPASCLLAPLAAPLAAIPARCCAVARKPWRAARRLGLNALNRL